MTRLVNVKEFKMRATKYLGGEDEVVITKRGRPMAVLTPIGPRSAERILTSIGEIFREAGVRPADAQDALDRVRRRLYGPRRS
ncbi:MAG: hypothetical protein A3G34_15335 [Candidatus Lindowbacteria bacterium RIFCSPLOWO2_12_FULL_62_27]|nr:MAG: hypothetical protein A3G34_15335 [Candidatus Lindowbacteria bacterium RIFCSPLOWO2_12_FULL_62_27]OGH63913.1 MAG: hypothetical protein A3I06_05075 [Candidatus Lindowbacteria bacterium RIFCSPLOWO2_02_FULL_62_12]